jgi:WD40 repeat protein
LVATGGEEKVTVWDATTGASLFVLPHDDEVDYVCFSPDGTLLATASVSGVRVWTLDSVE